MKVLRLVVASETVGLKDYVRRIGFFKYTRKIRCLLSVSWDFQHSNGGPSVDKVLSILELGMKAQISSFCASMWRVWILYSALG